ncbi:MAG TPA: HupE/UreJ family protein [Myxococcaceae bacterium]|nr:HupE/UreJ family protein [Myxococcaceae bacterium]
MRASRPSSRRHRSFLLAVVLLAPALGQAHALRLSRGDWSLEPGTVEARLTFFRGELPMLAPDGLDEAAVEAAALGQVASSVQVRAAGEPCELARSASRPVEEDGVRFDLRWRCPAAAPRWSVVLPFVADLSPGHTHLARVTAGGHVMERVARASAPGFGVEATPSALSEAGRFLRLGMEHIFTGWDHLAFLLGLLLLGGSLSRLAGIVSSFTIAHSVTLALAALGVVSIPASIVEPAIAASVVAVAAENLWALRPGADGSSRVAEAVRRRWRITFCFGLVHGFGFAGALQELALPRAALAAGLVSFNLGVELGQLLVILAVVPLFRLARRHTLARVRAAPALSWALAGLGVLWLGERIAGLA